MELPKKIYNAFDALALIFKASPAWASLHVFLSLALSVMPTALTALTTAGFVDTASAILRGERPHDDIYLPLVLLLLVMGLVTTTGAVVQLLSSRIGLDLTSKLKPSIVQIHAALDFKHIENAESWELISRVSRDPVLSLMTGFEAYVYFLRIVFSVVSVIMLIVTQVWWAALIIIAFSTPMFWVSLRAGRKNYQAGRDAEKFNRRTEYLDEVLSGRDAVDERSLFGFGRAVSKRWSGQYEAGRILQFKVSLRMYLVAMCSGMLLALVSLLVTLTLIGPVISGLLSAGMFIGIVGAVFGVVGMIGWQLSGSLENISKLGEYMKDFTAFVYLSKAEGSLCLPDPEPIEFRTLEFRNVRFRYPSGDRQVLDGLSFTLEEGVHYAFVGVNGAGKTTITKLLTGLYSEYEGEILINGRDLRTFSAGELKALFSVVYQDHAKYYIRLNDNIRLGDAAENVAGQVLSAAASQAGLDGTIAELSNGADTPLGKIMENSQDISGGQWQRVAIARSVVSRAPVKILDEPTAALDPISESRIYGEFERLMRGRTTIFISHRLGSTKLADEILVIDGGSIIERGKHSELMAAKGLYFEMFEAQLEWYR